MRIIRCFGLGVVAASLAAMSQPVMATTFINMDATELAEASVAVVNGRVTGIESRVDEVSGAIHTFVRIESTEVVLGAGLTG